MKKSPASKLSPSVIYGPHGSQTPVATTYAVNVYSKTKKNILLNVCIFILVMELAERLSYYGINQGLKNFMKKLGWSSVVSNSIKSTWTSLCYLSPLFGAWVADEKWGRYKTIVVFGVWYLVGDFLVAFAAHPDFIAQSPGLANGLFMIGLFVFIGIGTGAIKSNVVTFGADQFNDQDPDERIQRQAFFSWFYWCINIGACFSYGYLSILCVNGAAPLIPQNQGYFGCYLICALVMGLAIVIFIAGKPRYKVLPPSESALTKLFNVMKTNASVSIEARVILGAFVLFCLSFLLNATGVFVRDSQPQLGDSLSIAAGVCCLLSIVAWIWYGMDPSSYLNRSKTLGHFPNHLVDEIALVIRVLPFASFMVMWHCVYDQIDANFQSITQQCDLRLDRSNDDASQIPGATLGVFGTLSIIVIIPILERIVYPLIVRVNGRSPSPYAKVLAGLTIASACMFYTGIFETFRRKAGPLVRQNCLSGSDCAIRDLGGDQPMNNISWMYVIPMYLCVGLAECLVNVTAFDLFYSNVPVYLKSTCQAINLFMIAMGSNVTSIFTLAFAPYIPDDLNEGRLEFMYYVVGAFSLINVLIYAIVMHRMNFGMHSSPQYNAPPEAESEAGSTIKDKAEAGPRLSHVSSVGF